MNINETEQEAINLLELFWYSVTESAGPRNDLKYLDITSHYGGTEKVVKGWLKLENAVEKIKADLIREGKRQGAKNAPVYPK